MRISFDRVASIYDKTRRLPNEVMKKIVQVLVEELRGQKTILDIGVGTGRFANPLQESGFEVVGIDISRNMIQNAREKGVSRLLRCDTCFLPFTDAYFDAVLSVHVLHLISDWRAALKEVCRVTRNELFSVVQMSKRNPISEAYEELAKERGYHIRHVGLGERQLTEMLKPARSVLAASMVSRADDHLVYLGQRAYSRQWRVPEDVDEQIVRELASRFAGQEYQTEIHVLSWRIGDLRSMRAWDRFRSK